MRNPRSSVKRELLEIAEKACWYCESQYKAILLNHSYLNKNKREVDSMMTTEEMIMYDQLVELGIATSDEINLAFNVGGKGWTDTLNAILYIRTGYRSIPQMLEEEE